MTLNESIERFYNSQPFRVGVAVLILNAVGISIAYQNNDSIPKPQFHAFACDGTKKTRTGLRFSHGRNREFTEYAVCIQGKDTYKTPTEIREYNRQ